MKKLMYLTSVFFLIVLGVACKKDKDEEVKPEETIETIKLLKSVSTDQTCEQYYYNDNNQITKIDFNSSLGGAFAEEFQYNENNQLTKCIFTIGGVVRKNYAFSYSPNKITIDYTYYLSPDESELEGCDQNDFRMEFMVDDNLQIQDYQVFADSGDGDEIVAKYKAEYTNGNLMSLKEIGIMDNSVIEETLFTYDDKKNPLEINQNKFFNFFNLIRNIQYFYVIQNYYEMHLGGHSLANNMISIYRKRYDQIYTYDLKYTYDEEGYPTDLLYSNTVSEYPELNNTDVKIKFDYTK